MKKILASVASAAALLGAFAAPAYAASTFHLVVPLGARTQAQEPVASITVSLAGAALPAATVSKPYSESLLTYLSVTGDAAFDPAAARWSLAAGTLPTGLALDEATGTVAGTPTAKTTSPVSFTVLASYKGSDGQAGYTIEVAGVVFNVSKIVAGTKHTCALMASGGVKCWGRNTDGQLGTANTADSLMPADVSNLSRVTNISAGHRHTCVVTDDTRVKCWGFNEQGQVGDGSKVNQPVPVAVPGLTGVVALAGGYLHTCALISGGSVQCWGYNGNGQLGNNSTTSQTTPVAVQGLTDATMLVSGTYHTCALVSGGSVKCWGNGSNGQLGNGNTVRSTTPVDVLGLTNVTALSSGYGHTCALVSGGSVKCWGYNGFGELGDGTTISARSAPVDVLNLADVTMLSTGSYSTCALVSGGSVKCWGDGSGGRLGDNSTTLKSPTPVDVLNLSGVTAISSGNGHTCAVTDENTVKCWGYNDAGQLGDNSATNRSTPVDVQGIQ